MKELISLFMMAGKKKHFYEYYPVDSQISVNQAGHPVVYVKYYAYN